jgi:hypothetical protein
MTAGDAETVGDPRIRNLIGRLTSAHRDLLEALTLADLAEPAQAPEPAEHRAAASKA